MGLQLAARPFDELTLFQAGHAYQEQTGWHTQWPEL
jgi:Asp-tRNA(Asn)/Glu-tRNA(Gln) amidotransferase A subunit family amidase